MSRASKRTNYEQDPSYTGKYYRVAGWGAGIAFYVLGWETQPDEDTEWSGLEERTGQLLAVMVGDDARHRVDPEDLSELARAEFCGECGQIGCSCDGLDRSEEDYHATNEDGEPEERIR